MQEVPPEPDERELEAIRRARREFVQLVALAIIGAVAFGLTRAVAQWQHREATTHAQLEFERGAGELQAGQPTAAARSFRKAYLANREETRYALALSDALVQSGQGDEARHILTRRRDEFPENPDINLQLARLAAHDRDLPSAERYYHSAIYGVWPADEATRALDVRIELIRYLLANDIRDRALAELLSAADRPLELPRRLTLAQLFEGAGDNQRALLHYRDVLDEQPANATALAGAGAASFALGDYDNASRYLSAAVKQGDASPRATRLMTLTDLIRTQDPLLPRISSEERRRRLLSALDRVRDRLTACAAAPTPRAGIDHASLLAEVTPRRAELTARGARPDTDEILDQLDLIARIERTLGDACGAREPIDEALGLIASRHGVTS